MKKINKNWWGANNSEQTWKAGNDSNEIGQAAKIPSLLFIQQR